MKTSKIALLLIGLLLVGCAMPSTVVKSTDTRPSIAILGAQEGSLLYVDGLNMGKANNYDGKPNVLMVEAGTHKISIVAGNKIVYEKSIFVESELKQIIVR